MEAPSLDVVALIKDVGPSLALLAYFAWKDYKFTARVVELMGRVEAVLERIASDSKGRDAA